MPLHNESRDIDEANVEAQRARMITLLSRIATAVVSLNAQAWWCGVGRTPYGGIRGGSKTPDRAAILLGRD